MRLSFVATCLGFVASVTAEYGGHKCPKIPALINATLQELHHGLNHGHFTSVDLVQAYTERIHEVNGTLNVVTELNPDAIAIAQASDERRAKGLLFGPLDGIPVLIKMNIGTDDKMNTTAGSYALLGAKAPRDSTVAAKLRKAGAVLLGKTNLSQWANFRSDNTTNGWSAYGGQCTGAYVPNQDPSGSSSGSGVASSIGLAWATLGTETSGSIISPGSVNNLVGIKPTVGLTSRHLVVPISEHQDTVGPLARTVRDAVHLLSAIAGPDPYDNYTSAIPGGVVPDYALALNASALQGARIGVPVNAYAGYVEPAVEAAFQAAMATIEAAGATLVVTNFTDYATWLNGNLSLNVLEIDFYSNVASYFSEQTYIPSGVSDLASLTNFTESYKPEDYPERDVDLWTQAIAFGYGNTDIRFWTQYLENMYFGGPLGVEGAISNYSVDALLLPSDVSPYLPAVIGSPIVTVPMGFYPAGTNVTTTGDFGNLVETAPDIPFGISFMGKRFDESTIIGLAYAYEQLTQVRKHGPQPAIQPTTELADVVNCSTSWR